MAETKKRLEREICREIMKEAMRRGRYKADFCWKLMGFV